MTFTFKNTNFNNTKQKCTFTAAVLAATVAMVGCQNTSPVAQQHADQPHSTQDNKMTDGNNARNQSWISSDLLGRYHWSLVSAKDSNNQPITALEAINKQVALNFTKQQQQAVASFSVGCNQMAGQVDIINNVMSIDNIMSTEMMCDPALNQAETLLANAMQGQSQLSEKGGNVPMLTQITSNGTTLVWQGSMTATAKYGHQGETIFWAVDHQTQPCADGSTKTCLKVKPISYNEQGIKTTEGDWTLFSGEIEGYTHDGKHNQVLRLKRYVVNPSDVKGKQYAYVLDTLIESQLVK